MLVAKLNILKPCLCSADIAIMEADVQRNSGKLSQDCIKTIGIEDIEKLAEEQKQNDPEIKMTDARANGLLTLKRSPARMDEYGHI